MTTYHLHGADLNSVKSYVLDDGSTPTVLPGATDDILVENALAPTSGTISVHNITGDLGYFGGTIDASGSILGVLNVFGGTVTAQTVESNHIQINGGASATLHIVGALKIDADPSAPAGSYWSSLQIFGGSLLADSGFQFSATYLVASAEGAAAFLDSGAASEVVKGDEVLVEDGATLTSAGHFTVGGDATVTSYFTVMNSSGVYATSQGERANLGSLSVGGVGSAYVEAYGGTVSVTGAADIGEITGSAKAKTGVYVNGAGVFSANSLTLGGAVAKFDAKAAVWSYTGGGGALGIGAGGYVSIAKTLTVDNPELAYLLDLSAGSLEVGGSSARQTGRLKVDAGGLVVGHFEAKATSIVNAGTIEARDGTLALDGAVSGAGVFVIDQNAALEFMSSVAVGAKVNFAAGYRSTLLIDDATHFKAVIGGLQDGDTILLTKGSWAHLPGGLAHTQISGNTLIVTASDGATLAMALGGGVSGHVFTIRDFGNDAYGLIYEPVSANLISGSAGGAGVSGAPTSNAYINSLIWGWGKWNLNAGPITYWFGGAGDLAGEIGRHGSNLYLSGTSTLDGWTTAEESDFLRALADYASITGLTFKRASSAASANIVWWLDPGIASQNAAGVSDVPARVSDGHLWEYFNDKSWVSDPGRLSFGGFGLETIIHEIGHGLGLAHPHDGGAEPGRTIFPGVTGDQSSGTYGLNQTVFTVMSYVQGWKGLASLDYGTQGALGAFDIAALQTLYGKNMTFHTGNDIYRLPLVNGAGTGYACIWDAGGADTISNAGSTANCTIDLRAAPLTGPNAGGYVSFVDQIHGGFTIANGVTIENAVGGAGNDILVNGDKASHLTGGGGVNYFEFPSFDGATSGQNIGVVTDFSAPDLIVLSGLDANAKVAGNQAFTFIGEQAFTGVAGQLDYRVSGGNAFVYGDTTGGRSATFSIELLHVTNLTAADFKL